MSVFISQGPNEAAERPEVPSLRVCDRYVGELKPYAGNPRTHSKRQIRQIADSIRTFGFVNPVLIDRSDRIIAGHGRVAAAKLLALATVPTIQLEDLTDEQVKVYVLADNRLAEIAGWDPDLLAIELQHLTNLDLNFDITVTGFATADIDLILDEKRHAESDERENVLPPSERNQEPVTRLSDLWLMGPHRLLCGDAVSTEACDRLMAGQKARMVIIDPPFNVKIDGHVCGLGTIRHREFPMAAGEMNEAEFTAFLKEAIKNLCGASYDGALHYIFIDWRHLSELLAAARPHYLEQKNLCIWNKTNGGMGSFYRSKHELIAVYKYGKAPHINNIELGRHGRYRTNVWDYAGISSLGSERQEVLSLHPTVKPVAMIADAILDASNNGDIVLDTFSGSGTIFIAAERVRRRAFAMELDPCYVDVAIRRWQTYTGGTAHHADTGRSFSEMALERGVQI
jgi:DNA modification methylase